MSTKPKTKVPGLFESSLKIPAKIVRQIGYLPKSILSDHLHFRTQKLGQKTGLPPGSLVHIGTEKSDRPEIEVMDYSSTDFTLSKIEDPKDCLPFKQSDTVSWINVSGVHDAELIGKIGEVFGLHPLLLEDILNTTHRPKIEDLGDYIYVTLKMLSLVDGEVQVEHLSLILAHNYVITFQEERGDIFDPIRERIKVGKGKARFQRTDYLLYVLIDTVVDNYYSVIDHLGERIESLESEILTEPKSEYVPYIQAIKKDLIFLRKTIFPVREVVGGLQKADSEIIKESSFRYFSDVYDHVVQVMESLDIYWEMISNLMDAYYASISNKMNEVMKVLTIIATLFIPMTFVAGIYGMNFEYMPELGYRFGYPLVWLFIFMIAATMLIYFRKKKWF